MAGAADDATPERVAAAVRAGWTLARLRTSRPSAGEARAPRPEKPLREHLPSASETSGSEQLEFMFNQVSYSLRLIGADDDILASIDGYASWSDSFDQNLDDAFVKLHAVFSGNSPKLGTALSLGHILSDTVYLPQHGNPDQNQHSFGHWRLQNAYEWLDALHSHLPVGAAGAVSGSLNNWEQHVASGGVNEDPDFIRHLRRQGDLWLALLCGDKAVAQQLRPDHYSRAAAQLAAKLAHATGAYLRQWWPLVASLGLLAVIGGIVTAVFLPSDQKLAGVLVALLGTVGISWKTVGASLGRIFAALRDPLWEAEKTEAAIEACTLYVPSAQGTCSHGLRR